MFPLTNYFIFYTLQRAVPVCTESKSKGALDLGLIPNVRDEIQNRNVSSNDVSHEIEVVRFCFFFLYIHILYHTRFCKQSTSNGAFSTVANNSVTNQHKTPSARKKISSIEKRFALIEKQYQSRKRKRQVDLWKRNVAKNNRARGLPYISYNNVSRPAKQPNLEVLCRERCRFKCTQSISCEERESLFAEFYTRDVNQKNLILFNSINRAPVKRHRPEAVNKKSNSYQYAVKLLGRNVRVCKRALCAIYQISCKKLEIIQRKMNSGEAAPSNDRRGRHDNRPAKTVDQVLEKIRNHINSFPADESHYSRNRNPNKKYLASTLNITKMYSLYIEECEAEQLPAEYKVKYGIYNTVFNNDFNLSFREPRSDTCSVCDAGKADEAHLNNWKLAQSLMHADKEKAKTSENTYFITMDMQQAIPLPKLSTSKAFYLRQLSFYNFGVHCVSREGVIPQMFVWNECEGKKGSAEIGSCLLEFAENCKTKGGHLVIWSDNCAGQNKNINLIYFYQYLVLKGYFTSIDHKFPEVGHTYLDSDRDFGRIEKVMRKHENIYVPSEYVSIMKSASTAKTKVTEMNGKFRDIGSLMSQLHLFHNKCDENGDLVHFRDGIKWIRVNEFGSYLFKETYDENTPFKKVTISQSKDSFSINDVSLEPICRTLSPKPLKIDNLKKQLPFIPAHFRWFYDPIIADKTDGNNNRGKVTKKKQSMKPKGLQAMAPKRSRGRPKKMQSAKKNKPERVSFIIFCSMKNFIFSTHFECQKHHKAH